MDSEPKRYRERISCSLNPFNKFGSNRATQTPPKSKSTIILGIFIPFKAIPIKCFVSHGPPLERLGRIKKKNPIQKIISKWYNSFKLNTFLFSLKFPKIWVGYVFFKWYFEKKWVDRAMGNKTIYWHWPNSEFTIWLTLRPELDSSQFNSQFNSEFVLTGFRATQNKLQVKF